MSSSAPSDGTLFSDALQRPASERAAFLDAACAGDGARRARVEALLEAHGRGTGELGSPVARTYRALDEVPGEWIGRFKLLLQLGEGGCGIVFLAEQEEPVRRRVALKVIKAGMDSREVIARFEVERQALALMDHPGICKVLDAGETATGRPYFVMELVQGVPITRFCDDNRLTSAARLRLFVQVCHAVQHAHQKGIIHRDIKPSNILVTQHGTVAAPRVIDFGIAKATQGRLTEATLVTRVEQFIGTPAYMSPEQAGMSGLDIDARSDVYSLGVLLYELLIGRPPFAPKSLIGVSQDQLRRIICEVEPPKPSAYIATMPSPDRSAMADRRGTGASELRHLLAGDIDWIVMKALEKDRDRRYDTPAALAEDIGRYLENEPVVARPPSRMYRIRKFVRRHRVGVAAVSAVALVLVAGTVISTAQAIRARQAEKVGDFERRKAVAARDRAEDLLEFMLGDLRTDVQKLGKLDLLEKVGDKATAYFASLDPRELNDTALRQQAKTLRQIAEVQFDKARYDPAMQSLEAAMDRTKVLVQRKHGNGDVLFEHAQIEFWIGAVHMRRGELARASECWARYRDQGMALLKIDPENYHWKREFIAGLHNFGVLEMENDRFSRATEMFETERAMVEELRSKHPDERQLEFRLADISSWLGTAAERQGNLEEALRRYRDQTDRLQALLQHEPTNMRWRQRLSDSLSWQADVLAVTARQTEAQECLQRAQTIMDQLVRHDAAHRRWQLGALYVRLKSIALLQAAGDFEMAEQLLRAARPRLETLFAEEPTDRTFAARLVMAWRLEAELRLSLGRTDAATAAKRAVELAARFTKDTAGDSRVIGEWALARITAGAVAAAEGQSTTAAAHWSEALDLLSTRVADSKDWRLLDPAARALLLLNRRDEARALVARLDSAGYQPFVSLPGTTPLLSR